MESSEKDVKEVEKLFKEANALKLSGFSEFPSLTFGEATVEIWKYSQKTWTSEALHKTKLKNLVEKIHKTAPDCHLYPFIKNKLKEIKERESLIKEIDDALHLNIFENLYDMRVFPTPKKSKEKKKK